MSFDEQARMKGVAFPVVPATPKKPQPKTWDLDLSGLAIKADADRLAQQREFLLGAPSTIVQMQVVPAAQGTGVVRGMLHTEDDAGIRASYDMALPAEVMLALEKAAILYNQAADRLHGGLPPTKRPAVKRPAVVNTPPLLAGGPVDTTPDSSAPVAIVMPGETAQSIMALLKGVADYVDPKLQLRGQSMFALYDKFATGLGRATNLVPLLADLPNMAASVTQLLTNQGKPVEVAVLDAVAALKKKRHGDGA